MSTTNEKKVNFVDDKKEEKQKILTAKVKYLWKDLKGDYHFRNKIVRSLNENLKVVVLNSEIENKEVLLNPRFITVNPFTTEETIFVVSDIFSIDGQNLNSDQRADLAKFLEEKKDKVESSGVKVSYQFRFNLYKKDKDKILDDLAEIFTKARLSISNYFLDHNDYFVFDSEFINPISACDELFMFQFILNKYAKWDVDLEFKEFKFKIFDNFTNGENGLENMTKYEKKLESFNFKIPESQKKFKKGYFELLNNNLNECKFGFIKNVLQKMYEEIISSDI